MTLTYNKRKMQRDRQTETDRETHREMPADIYNLPQQTRESLGLLLFLFLQTGELISTLDSILLQTVRTHARTKRNRQTDLKTLA